MSARGARPVTEPVRDTPPTTQPLRERGVCRFTEEPWDAAVMPPGKDPAYRMTVFGAGYGLLTFHADDASEIIRIFDITWIG
jgi:hypothetical protein